jgi:hypothetical protein
VTRMVADEEYVFVCQGTSNREGSMLVLAESSCEVVTSLIEIVGVVIGDKGACSELQLSPVAGPLPGYFDLNDMKAEKRMKGCQMPYLWRGCALSSHGAPYCAVHVHSPRAPESDSIAILAPVPRVCRGYDAGCISFHQVPPSTFSLRLAAFLALEPILRLLPP